MAPDRHAHEMTGRVLRQRYQIQQPLGEGGFAYTYRAVDLDRPGQPPCVIKRLKPQADRATTEQAQRLFTQEAGTLAQLYQRDQPNRIPELLAYFEEKGEFFLVQEWIEGHTLDQEILADQPWSEAAVVALMWDVLEALTVLHQNQVIHRDLKPSNIMRRQRDGRIFVIDFGAVKQDSDTGFTVAIGTAGYMPLEQLYGTPKLASDLYALGAIALQALSGKLPTDLWDGDRQQLVWRDRVPVSPALGDWLDRMVAPPLTARYRNASEALAALPLLGEESAISSVPSPIPGAGAGILSQSPAKPATDATAIASGAAAKGSGTVVAAGQTPDSAGQTPSDDAGFTTLLRHQRQFPWGPVLLLIALILGSLALAIARNQSLTPPPAPAPDPIAQASPSPSPSPTQPTLDPQNPFATESFPKTACGDSLPQDPQVFPVSLYPVYANPDVQTLSLIKSNFCQDAYLMQKKDTGTAAIQVASFLDIQTAQYFAEFLQQAVGSGEVGPPNKIDQPQGLTKHHGATSNPITTPTPTTASPTPPAPTSPPLPTPTPASTPTPTITFTLVNSTVNESICKLYIWTEGSGDRGPNWLNGSLQAGRSQSFQVPAGRYSLFVDNCGPGSMSRIPDGDLSRDRTWTIDEPYYAIGELDN